MASFPGISGLLLLLKARNPGYTRKDGTYVAPFTDKRAGAAQKPASASKPPLLVTKVPRLFGGFMAPDHAKDLGQAAPAPKPPGAWSTGSLFSGKYKPLPKSAAAHPRAGDKGETVMIHYPSKPTGSATWDQPDLVATFVPGGDAPEVLNGVELKPWANPPADEEAWDYVAGQNEDLEEPGMTLPKGKVPASGVVVLEPDGRVWVVSPTNGFGNTRNTFPKGGRELGLSLQANAIKECFEESGLQVEIDSFLGDVERVTSVARYYLARRVGGTPAAVGWESQAVHLVPVADLEKFLDRGQDKQVASWLRDLVGGIGD